MKSLKWMAAMVAAVVMCFGFISCGGSDNDDAVTPAPTPSKTLVGTWTSGTSTTETIVFGSDGSYNSTIYTPGYYIKNEWYSATTQTRKGSYSYNEETKILVLNIVAIAGSNNAYTQTLFVQTLDATTLVLIDSYGTSKSYNKK